ncbi:MAG: hypothetical protein VX762_01080 [Bacteroidota bacterium]|nr:hypothetical protein [Bacteroidota bacterium]
MRKLIYTFLALSIVFAACKKEEEENNPPSSPTIVGIWTPTSVDLDTSLTVTMMGMVVDSMSGSGTVTMTPYDAGIEGNLQFTNNGNMFVDGDTLDYVYSNNMLTITDEDTTFSIPCSFTKTSLSITIYDMNMDTSWLEMGIPISISYSVTQTVHCSKNTIINNNIDQRLGNSNNSWFVKPKIDNILKSIK